MAPGFLTAVVARADELKIRTLVLTDARVPGARLTRVRRDGELWVFDLKGTKPVEATTSPAEPGERRRRGRPHAVHRELRGGKVGSAKAPTGTTVVPGIVWLS